MATSAKVVLALDSPAFQRRVAIAAIRVANTVMSEAANTPNTNNRKALARDVVKNIGTYTPTLALVTGAFPAVQDAINAALDGQESFGPADAQLESAVTTAWNVLAGL